MLRFTTVLGLCCAASLAQAADNGFYLGAGAVQSDYGLANPGALSPFDDNTGGYKLIAGWRPLDSFGVEASYIDHGNATVPSGIVCIQFITVPCPASASLTAKTLSAFAVGYLDLPLVDLFAKVGVNSWKFDGHSIGGFVPVFRVNESGTDLAYGAGIQVRFGSVGARLEYERFNIVQNEGLDTISLSLTYTFL
ncbi:MAG: porin family protein [Gammaproteobacteria bacterium]|nr:porin family protein [Gammaproteobacteria bacterium]